MDNIHGEIYSREHKANLCLVETVESVVVERDYPTRTIDKPVWEIQWSYDSDDAGHVERFPNQKEAMVRWVQLIAQNGVSP